MSLLKKYIIFLIGRFLYFFYNIFIAYNEERYLKLLKKNKLNKVIIQYPASITFENLEIGDNVYIGPNSKLWATHSKIILKGNIVIGPNLTIMGGDHNFKVIGNYIIDTKQKKKENDLDVVINEDCWIGSNVTILKGVNIGKGSIIAAGSVITKEIEPYSIVGGNPCKILKKRFTEEEIKLHEEIIKSKIKIY